MTGPANRWSVLAVMSAALLIVVIDTTVLHVASPAIAADLRPSAVSLLWVIDIYPLVVAPLLLVTATLGDRFGRKRMLVAGLVVFGAASVLAALAWSPLALIGARALQGVGGAMIMPSTMSIIRVVFPDRAERVRAVGIWSATLAGGAAVGPLVGGVLIEHLSWHAVFLINVPVVALVLPLALRVLPESRSATPPPWDLLAVAQAAAGVLLVTFGIKEGARHGLLDVLPVVTTLGGVALLAAFARRQLTRVRPLLDLRLFARPAFAAATAAVLLSMFALVGLELFFAQYLQLVLGLSPLDASVRLVPLMASTFAGSLVAARVLGRLGSRWTIAGGLGLSAAALLPLLALGTADEYLLLVPAFVVLGAALEIALVGANDIIVSSVSADDAGQATAVEETSYELGGGLGIAVLGSIGAAVYTSSMAGVPGPAAARGSLTEATSAAASLPQGAADALLGAARAAFVDGLHVTLAVAIGVIAVSAVVVAWVLRPRGGVPADIVHLDEPRAVTTVAAPPVPSSSGARSSPCTETESSGAWASWS